nr:uncharacterized protein LOC124812537 [Hydra vulgaris]
MHIVQSTSPVTKEKVLSTTINNLVTHDAKITLNTFGPKKLVVSIGVVEPKTPYFSHSKLKQLQSKLHTSDNKMLEIARFIRVNGGRKSVEPYYSEKLTEENKNLLFLFDAELMLIQSKQNTGDNKKVCIERTIPGVICDNVDEFVATVLRRRSLEPENVDVKIGVDGGQGYLKVTLSITLKPELEVHSIEKKRVKYSDEYGFKEFKYTSVHKTLVLAVLPSIDENYANIKMLLDKLKLNSLDYSISEDLKVLLLMVGKQSAASKHPCPFCETELPNMLRAKSYSLTSLCDWCNKWMAAGGNIAKAKNFSNVVNPPLLTGNVTKKILEIVNIPGLHILLGIVDKLLKIIEKNLFEDTNQGFNFVNSYLSTINLARVPYQGKHRLEGNASNKFLKKLDCFQIYLDEHNIIGGKYMKALRDFSDVVHGCFGKILNPNYSDYIKRFSQSFRDLGSNIPLKVHIVEHHVKEFIVMKGGKFGLGYWTEQALESVHQDFKQFWEIRKNSFITNPKMILYGHCIPVDLHYPLQ